MIPAIHIHKQAARDGVKEQTVEKDYALTWFLLALSELPDLRKLLRFKGGTCIRKMYFPHWRYSEDVDFTLIHPIPAKDIRLMVDSIAKKASQLSGVVFRPQAAEPIQEAGHLESEVVYVDYIGPLQRTSTPRKFKVDLTAGELLIGSPGHRKVLGLFDDQKDRRDELPVYSLEEISAEKARSLLQRREPRDLYDIWRLLGEVQELDRHKFVQMFQEKCEFKEKCASQLKPDEVVYKGPFNEFHDNDMKFWFPIWKKGDPNGQSSVGEEIHGTLTMNGNFEQLEHTLTVGPSFSIKVTKCERTKSK